MKEKNTEMKKAQISPELVAKAKAGDQAAFTELYKQTSTELYRSIRSMVHDEDLAWDIQQDTYLRVYQNLGKLDHNEAFLPWLRRISVNVTATHMSKRLPATFSELTEEDEDQPELPDLSIDSQPELALDRKESSRLVREILAQLPEVQHLVLGMRYYEDLSITEISDMLHLTPGTVRIQLFRGRKKVETAVRELEKQGVKLYGLSPLAFLVALMKQQAVPTQKTEAVLAQTLAKAGLSAGTKAVGSGAVGAAGETVALHVGRRFFETAVGKLVLGVIVAGVIGGGVAGYRWFSNHRNHAPGDTLPTDGVQLLVTSTTQAENAAVPTDPAPSSAETAPADETEADRDAISVANMRAACEEATASFRAKTDTENAVILHLPGQKAGGVTCVGVKDVVIRSEEANDWSELASDLPQPAAKDDGVPGTYCMVTIFYYTDILSTYLLPQSDFNELLLDDNSFVNISAAYEEALTVCQSKTDTQNASYVIIPGHEDTAIVAVRGVSILSERADNWSGLIPFAPSMPEDPGKPGTYMMVYFVHDGALRESTLVESDDPAGYVEYLAAHWDENLEKSYDTTSLANLRSAYCESQAALLTEESSGNCEYAKSVDDEGVFTATVTVRNVIIRSEKADNWSGFGVDEPFLLPEDPGVPGFYTVIYTYSSSTSEEYGGWTAVSFGEFRAFLDYTEINKQNSDPQERSLEEEDFRNLRAAYAEMINYYLTEGHAGTSREYEVRQRVKGWHQELYDFNTSSSGSDAPLRDAAYALSERTGGKFTLTVSADENGEVKVDMNLFD